LKSVVVSLIYERGLAIALHLFRGTKINKRMKA